MQEEERRDFSGAFFSEVPELQQIQDSFSDEQIANEVNRRDLETEFELIRTLTQTKKHKQRLRLSAGQEARKNRYPQQSIYEHSRIILDSGNEYINANCVFESSGKCYIITQGPLENTMNDFVQMLSKYQISCVAMLCRPIENGKPRCYDYLNSMSWSAQETDKKQNIQITDTKVEGCNQAIEHLYYKDWPDRGVPSDPAQIDFLIQKLAAHSRVVIHCSAGLGRSGVVAAILQALSEERENKKISIFGIVRKLRESRFGAVQNSQQYRFIYNYLSWRFARNKA